MIVGAVLVLGAFVAWMVIDGAVHQQRHRHWPRGRIATIVGFAYSLGLWSWRDQFGYKPDKFKPQPPDTPIVAMRVEELLRHETERHVEEKTKAQEILGG